MRTQRRQLRFLRRGLTLVELLVVLGILSVLLGIAATAVKTGTQGKKQREAARQVNAFIAGAQARAVELGRPVGIEIVRQVRDTDGDGTPDAGISNTSLLMYMIETPPAYAGDVTNARAYVTMKNSTNSTFQVVCEDASILSSDAWIGEGDSIRLGYRGDKYRILSKNNNTLNCQWDFRRQHPPVPWSQDITSPITPYYDGVGPLPYQIYAQPQRNSVTPVQIPTDMCIDLICSGLGASGNQFANWMTNSHASIRFTFSPSGKIDRVSVDGTNWERPTGNVHLLVGKFEYAINAQELLGTDGLNDRTSFDSSNPASYENLITDPDLLTNLADPSAMWVSINYLTGQVTTTRNGFLNNPFPFGSSTTTSERNRMLLSESRRFATRVLTVQGQGE